LLSSNNLANDRVRRLYTALTDDQIQDTPFGRISKNRQPFAIRRSTTVRGYRPNRPVLHARSQARQSTWTP
jgi:hypothetical protein